MALEDTVPKLSPDEIAELADQLAQLRAAGRVAVRNYLQSARLGLGGDLQLDAPCAFSNPKRGITEASYRGELRR